MLFPRVLLLMALVAPFGCGDNLKPATPDGGMPPDGGGSACSLNADPAALDHGTWDPRFTVPGFTRRDGSASVVFDFARDVDGSIVAVGKFSYLGAEHVPPMLRWKNGEWIPARTTWEIEPPVAGFSAIAIDASGKLALATFDELDPRAGEIWLDDGSGLRVIGTFNGLIRVLTWYDGDLWVAGWDEILEGPDGPILGVAVWNGATWAPPPGGAPDGFVYELVHDGDGLLAGGRFTQIGGIAAANVAAFDGTSWRALDFPGADVFAFARDASGELYAGGSFGLQFGTTGGLAHWTGTAWELAAGGLGNGYNVGVVTDVVRHDDSLYVAGCFRTAGGDQDSPDAVSTYAVARFDGQWHALDDYTKGVVSPWYEEGKCADEGPGSQWAASKQRWFEDGTRILLGGSFPGIAGVYSQGIIAYDGSAWVPQGPSGLGFGGYLEYIAASSSCDVWGGGYFTHVSGVFAPGHVVHFTGDAWEPISDSLAPDAYCRGLDISPGGEVAVGCKEDKPNGDPVGHIYHVSGTQLVAASGDLPVVLALAYSPSGTLWVGGFTTTGTGFLGRLDGETFTMVEDGFDAPVTHLDVTADDDMIVAGPFTKVGALDAARIARWDGTAWHALGDGLPATVAALAHDDKNVYVSTYDEGAGRYMLGAFDGTSWKELATPASGLTPNPKFNFNALRVVGDKIIAVGTAFLDDNSAEDALVFENGRFRALGGGVGASSLTDIAVTSDAIWIAGSIGQAGTGDSATSTVGVARYVLAPE